QIKRAYKTIYHSGLKLADALAQLSSDAPSAEVQNIIHFFENSKRGVTAHR
ncbi:MAG: acyl-[acyl-carrier-protein]--UDP-N-acetylglucosamine O-acyltransferase, partial [Gammaproteobacteria bacterium]|nr:acyl-[acyl-carrier-protein]--UDP-N-acetylglucosamine O-acyltransferase [Gammaproteobacteria bacterium]